MKTLRVLTAAMLVAATAAASLALADEPSVTTNTVTATRHGTALPAERIAPREDVTIPVIMPTDMPEAEIDYHLPPIAATPPAVNVG